MKDMFIKVKGSQTADGDTSVIELSTTGTLQKTDTGFVVEYTEEQTAENTSTKTALEIRENQVILTRSGDINSQLIITKGVRNSCFYSIPQGTLTLGIYGKEVVNRLSEQGGYLKMTYTLDSNLQPISENTVELFVEAR